ncbi:protein S-acyltransferase 11-like [Aristolochia californica]|uniref:protein S-acyltransferase 11-like n=1 Tax=Aristolochia californica TaxID=171875 RepID=UPI0035D7334A
MKWLTSGELIGDSRAAPFSTEIYARKKKDRKFYEEESLFWDSLFLKEEQHVASAPEGFESRCWGCGLRLLLPSYSPVFKCGWCGALTNQNRQRHESRCARRWRCIQDRIFTTILVLFMLFIIGGGAWAVYPVVFSVGLLCGIFHSTITFILCVSTLSSFWLAAFRSPGDPPNVIWGSYPVVDRGTLEDYTLCVYCAKPKSPRTHHCRSCSICVLDMDHHCPFIGNCVGAANHRSFITFLFSIILSTIYASIMAIYAGTHIWPPSDYGNRQLSYYCRMALLSATTGITRTFLTSALHLSARGIVLVYLFVVCTSVQMGLSVLLWQQLACIYMGHTYISHLSSSGKERRQKGMQNLFRFFGCPTLPFRVFQCSSDAGGKSHRT